MNFSTIGINLSKFQVMDEMIKKQIVTPSPSSKFDHSGDQSLTTPSSNRKYSSTSRNRFKTYMKTDD